MLRALHLWVTRRRRLRAALAERVAAQEAFNAARERKDTRALSAASSRLQRATIELLKFGRAA
jgi:hypothetical protein